MKKYLLEIIFFLICSSAMAQTDTCITNLKNASNNYDYGNYDFSISVLKATIKGCTLSKADLIQANKLLLLCYLRIDNLEAANETANAIMKIDPTYTPDKFRDDPNLTALFEKFKPQPTLAISLSGGINFPVIKVEKTYSVVHADDAPGLAYYETMPGYQINAGIEKRFYNNLWIEANFEFRNTGYKHTLDSVQGSTIYYSEKLNYFDIPLTAKYYFLNGRIKPYLQAGVDFSFLARALSITSRDNEQDLVDRASLRNNFTIGILGAAGVSYTIKSFSLFTNFRYTLFPDLINKTGTRYADDINLYKYYYIDDDFRMNNFQFNIGLGYILSYKRTKLK